MIKVNIEFGEDCEFINGGAWDSTEYSDSGIKVIKVSNLVNDGIDEKNISYLPADKFAKYEKHSLKPYDLVVTTVGSHPQLAASAAGRSFIISSEYEDTLLNQNAVCIRPFNENKLNKKYLGYLGKTEHFKNFIQSKGRGAANQMRIAIGEIKKYRASLPHLKTQQKIASILSAYDDLIENNTKRIKLLEEAAQNIYQEWFVNFRFPGYEKAQFENGLPKGWKQTEVRTVIDIIKGKKPKNELEIPTANSNLYLLVDVLERKTLRYTEDEKMPSSTIGDTLMLMDGSRSGCIFRGINGAIGSTTALLKVKDSITKQYCYHYFKYREGEIRSKNTGAAIPHANKSYVFNMDILIPNNSLLNLFEERVNNFLALIENLHSQNVNLKQARDILLPRLMDRTIQVNAGVTEMEMA